MCDNPTMVDRSVAQRRIGERVAEARAEASLTQAVLAVLVGMERTQLVRVEAGDRKVTVAELAAIAAALGRSIEWFVNDAPAAVVSRRRDQAPAHDSSQALDLALDRAARDVRFLVELGALVDRPVDILPVPTSYAEAEGLAADVRGRLGLGDGPIDDLGAVVEALGLVWYAENLDPVAGDGACVELSGPNGGRVGVAIINGACEPGRRRWTLVHELGHFLMGDAYAAEHPAGDVEKQINAFVAHLLMPRAGVERLWRAHSDDGPRRVAIALAARYRVSWSAACNQLRNLDRVPASLRDQLVADAPTRGDFLAIGESWSEDLRAPSVPPQYSQAVLGRYVAGDLSSSRAIELLRGAIGPDELPAVRAAERYPRLPSP